MPRASFYLTEADKAFLDSLPAGRTGAALLREAIAAARRGSEECAHERTRTVCRDCGRELDAHLVHTGSSPGVHIDGPGDETAAQAR